MDTKQLFKDFVKDTVKPIFKTAGYRKQNLNFYKYTEDYAFLFNIQKSRGNDYGELGFYINCSIHSLRVEKVVKGVEIKNQRNFPKYYQSHFRTRIQDLSEVSQREFGRFIIKANTDMDQLKQDVTQSFKDGLDFFDSITQTHEDFITYVCKHPTFENQDILRYCIRTNLEKETNTYLNVMKERFQDEARWEEHIQPILYGIIDYEAPNFETPAVVLTDAIPPITKETREIINHFAKFARWAINDKDYPTAALEYKKCLAMVPEPKTAYIEGMEYYRNIGKAYFLNKEYEKALGYLEKASACLGADTDAELQLLLGQTHFDNKEEDKALSYLQRARELKAAFPKSPKRYLNYLKENS